MTFVNFHALVLFVHILAAVVLVGTSLFEPVTRRQVRRADSTESAKSWLEFGQLTSRLNPLAAAVVLAAGIYLGTGGWSSYGWFRVSMVAFVANALCAGIVLKQLETRLSSSLTSGGSAIPSAADELRWSRSWDLAGGFLLANDLSILYLMIAKPDALFSVAIVLAAHLAVAIGSLASAARVRPSFG